jgi:hypothetical protein
MNCLSVFSIDFIWVRKTEVDRSIGRISFIPTNEIIFNEEAPDPICREKGTKNMTGISQWRVLVGYMGLACAP